MPPKGDIQWSRNDASTRLLFLTDIAGIGRVRHPVVPWKVKQRIRVNRANETGDIE